MCMTFVKDTLGTVASERESGSPKYPILFCMYSPDLIAQWFCEGGSCGGDVCLRNADWDG